jgi:hypothetical protein
MLPIVALFVCSSGWAGPVGDSGKESAPAQVSGAYSVTFHLTLTSEAAAGASIACKARIVPNLSSFDSLHRAQVPALTASGVATVRGKSATCLVEIPFFWTVGDTRSGVVLSYEIDSANPTMAPIAAQQTGAPYPPAGTVAKLNFDLRL